MVSRWMGEGVVDRALAYPDPSPISAELVEAIASAAADGPGALEAWMRTLNPAALSAVVAVITGEASNDDSPTGGCPLRPTRSPRSAMSITALLIGAKRRCAGLLVGHLHLATRATRQRDLVRVVYKSVEDRVCRRRLAEVVMPV